MTLNDIENIWLRRLSLVTLPVLIPLGILVSIASVAWAEVIQYIPSATVDAVKLMWNPKKVYH